MSVVTIVTMALSLGLPSALVPSGRGLVGWSALRNWLVAAPSWAREDPKVPQQQRGKGVDGHYVKAPIARDTESKRKAPGELQRYKPFNPDVKGKSTGSAPKGFDEGTSKRVAAMSNARTDVYSNADGSYTRRVYKNPVNFKAADGSWKPIESALKVGSDRRLESTANAFKVSFAAGTAKRVDAEGVEIPSASGGAAAAADEDLVRMTLEPGVELAYSLAGASLNKATVDRSVARYRNVFPGVDLELGAKSTGTKENLVLHSADVPTEYVYPLRLKGLTPRLNAAGEVEFVTAKGVVGMTMPAGFMEDSSNSHAGAGEVSYGVTYDLVQVDGGPALKVTIDGAWLRDPARKFPVVLDPQTRVVTQFDTYAISTAPTSARNLETSLAVGSWNGTEKARSFINFDGFPAMMGGQKLDSARLYLFMTYQGDDDGNPCVARAYNVYPITNAWTASTATWSNMPGYDTDKLMATDSPSSTAACNNDEQIRNVGAWSAPWLNTQYMIDWATLGGIYGLALTAAENDKDAWKRFTSGDTSLICPNYFGNTECDPFIEVNYSPNVAPQLDSRYPANNTAVNTLTPELSARGSDPDNYPNRGLRYKFLLYDDQGAPLTTTPSSPWTDGYWKVPAGTLTWGKNYLYMVQVDDRSSIGPANPVPFVFSTTVPQQLVSSSLAQNGGKGFEGSVGNYTTRDVDAQVTTVGPALSIAREYNSLDLRKSAFGQGWSSLVDMQVREGKDADGALQTAAIRYPNGQEVTFGRNNDGSWTPPSGRYAGFKAITGGYSLTDKDSTVYEFVQNAGTGVFGLTKISDPNGRALTVHYDSNGRADQIKSLASNRTLNLTWSTPPGASAAHVATVVTDPTDPAVPGSTLTYTYTYTGDQLTKVCPPGTTTDCARYEYQTVNQHNGTVLNTGPYSFWRFNDPVGSGTQARSGVLSNDGIDNGIYSNVDLGQPEALPNSTSKSAGFNGTNASVKLPEKLAAESSYQSISMWFKTSAPLGTVGVLLSYQKDLVTAGGTTPGYYNPALYVDQDGKLRGSIWNGTVGTITSGAAVNNGQWHHVALAGNGGSQQMYVDGVLQGSMAGVIQLHNMGQDKVYIGAGYIGGGWPGQPNTGTATAKFFNGSIADVAYYNKPLTQELVTSLYTSGKNPSSAMTKVTSNAGRVRAVIGYDTVSGRVNQVTDEAGGVWQVGQPTLSGSSQVYASTVLGSQPREYFRLNDISLPAQPKNQVADSIHAWYNNVTFDTTQPNTTSPFSDSYGAVFNGTSSYVRYDDAFIVAPQYASSAIEMWFKMPAGHASSAVLYAYQSAPVDGSSPATGSWVPALYVGNDGLLRGGLWTNGGTPMTSTKTVNDGNWHHVVLSTNLDPIGTDKQTLYLDNVPVGSKTAEVVWVDASLAYIGAGTTKYWPGASSDVSYFKGNITEFAYYDHALTDAQVDAHFKASKSALPPPPGATGPIITPVTTVTVTDPAGKPSQKMYDVVNGSRQIASTDTLGNTTTYGYDVGGFVSVVYDPLGQKMETAKDVRGNTVRTSTCSNATMWAPCQDTLYTYFPDSTTAVLTPDARNDQVLTVTANPGSFRTTDTAVTTFTYDSTGNRLTMVSPSVPGHPNGRTTTTTYTTATTPAIGGGFTPAGLPLTVTSPGGRVQRTDYNAAGDAVRVTDPGGLVTEISYDGLGRVTQQKMLDPRYSAGLVTTYLYDADGTLVQTTEPAVTNAVTGAQHTTRTTDEFDADGNVTSRTVSDLTGGDSPRSVTSAYNSYGQLVKSVDPMGVVTLYGYDAYGRQNSMVTCDSNPAVGSPCPTGDRLQVVNQTFDSEGHLLTSTTTGKDGTSVQETSNAYYANGTLATTTDAMNWTTKYEYFDNNAVKRISRTDGVKTTVLKETYYDSAGNPQDTTENNGATKTSFDIDNAGRLISQSVTIGDQVRTTNYVYDIDDRVVQTRNTARPLVSGEPTVLRDARNSYDAMSRLTSERVALDAGVGPVGWWNLDGEVPSSQFQPLADSSGSYHTMQAFRGTYPSLSNGYATFTDENMQTTTSVLDTTKSYSMSAWVKVNNFTSTQTAVSQTGSNRGAFLLQYNKDWNKWALQSPSADTTGAVSYNSATSSNALATNTWVHLVGVFDASTKRMSLYVNNARGTDGANTTPFASVNGLEIGGSHWGDFVDHFQGSIDNVQVYQRALTDADVATLWSAGNGRTADTVLTSTELTTSYTVDARGLTTDMVDPNGNTTSYVYDEDGNLTKTLAPTVSTEVYNTTAVQTRPTTTVGYNAFGEPVEQQDPLGNVTQARYDAAGRVWKTIMPSYTPPGGTAIVDASSIVVYDKLGRTTSTTDPRNTTTSYEYDTLGNVTKVTGPTGKITTAQYNAVGQVTEAVDPTGAKTTATYDYLGRKVTSTQVVRQPSPVSNTTTYDYGTGVYGSGPEAGPWLRKVTSPGGVTAEMTYNTLGEVSTQKDGAGNVTSTAYDGLGRPVLITNPDNTKTSTVYDGAGRMVQRSQLDTANAVLTTRSATYDNNGNLVTATDARGHTTTFTYNPLDQIVGESQPVTSTLSTNTSFGYDAAGNRTRFTDGRGNKFWSTYNTWGLPESQIEPSTTAHTALADRRATNVYDLGGRLTSRQLQSGVQIDYAYDDLGQVIGQTGSGTAVATAARTFGYDDAGRITSLSVPGGTNTITYDDRGLPLSITGPADNTSYTYNSDGNLTSRTDAAGTTNFTYDTAGRLQTMANATTNINLSVAYNTLNQPTTITYGASDKKRTFEYDTLHRLKTDTVTSFDGSVIQGAIAYGYDKNSNLTSKVTTGFAGASSNTYTYDWADRIQTWTTGSTTTNYSYDASGNRTENGAKTFTYDQRNRLTGQSGGISYSYTGRGTLKQVSGPAGVYNTAADAYGQVITQQSASGTTTYAYDALGRAVKPGFKYSGLSNDLADDGMTVYTRDPVGGVLAAGTGTGANSAYVWTDLHTDVVGQFTATGSSLTGSASYDPLGVVLASTGLVGSLGYQSEFTEQATGRVNMHARWYNTDTGQFDTRDTANNSPVPASINANRYQYGDGNPLTTTDPTGHWGWKSFTSSVSSTWNSVTSSVSNTYNYVASGQAYQDATKAFNYVVDKAKAATKVVVESTKTFVKKKVQSVNDKYNSVKKCVAKGVGKCATDTVKAAKKYAEDTIETIKKDPWKFVATAAVGIVAAVAVGALCATGVGCLILAGAVAGAMSAGAGYMVDVKRGDAEFSWSGLADTMIQGGLDGALSAGVGKFTGGATKYMGKAASGMMGGAAPRLLGGGSRAGMPSPGRSSSGGGGPAAGRPSTSSSGQGGHRAAGGSTGAGRNGGGGNSTARQSNGGSGAGGGCHSFDPATRVLLAAGTTKQIAEVVVGDQVVAADPQTGKTSTETVEQLHRNDDTDLTDLTVVIERGEIDETTVVKTTWHHPFWNEDTDAWIDAQDLKPGDHLRTANGSTATVTTVRNYVGANEMRDLTVANLHTYYVIVGDSPVLVHNNDLETCPLHAAARAAARGAPDDVEKVAAARLVDQGDGTPGPIHVGYSGPAHGDPYYDPALSDRADLGGGHEWDWDNCGEIRACNGALSGAFTDEAARLSNVEFATVYRQSGDSVAPCQYSCFPILIGGGARRELEL